MIRLIRIGGQIMEGNEDFAFWDTVRDRFVAIYGDVVFRSRADFEECCTGHGGSGEDIIYGGFDRLRGFLDSAAEGQPGGWVRAAGRVYDDDD